MMRSRAVLYQLSPGRRGLEHTSGISLVSSTMMDLSLLRLRQMSLTQPFAREDLRVSPERQPFEGKTYSWANPKTEQSHLLA